MPQTQQASSMPKEWYEQLYELAYGQPADQLPAETESHRNEKSGPGKWSAALLRFVPAFRV